ncbi:hypothetical protein [endosymbiont GvMRE of Glomus versiforme]|uniref:hypothetical protein n=1 Tax=endosymbiont GvMRE of Glomus versiforme TaxID=2039283 RepID=UPI000ED22355|nr:hypothetical protein [endosymbiont GvMRE of Glomus versiforme]RHZ35856.1 hypothetical protein GvMRE_Ic4g15 [endosymbiont GvMRE of Glomus versiforme]
MSELFSLIDDKFSKEHNEQQWTYSLHFNLVFNKRIIKYLTVTDYTWTKKGRETITKELIINIFKEALNEAILAPEPKKNPHWKRDHFVPQRIPFDDKKYKLVFWFKDGTDNHLWVKNCHQQD